MLQPKKTKYRKQFRGKMKGNSQRGSEISFGEFGLKSLGRAWLTANQIEAARKVLVRYIRKGGKMWIRVFPDRIITKKSAGAPMGAGKGEPAGYVAVIKPGKVIFEISGISEEMAREAFRLAAIRLPFKAKFVSKRTA